MLGGGQFVMSEVPLCTPLPRGGVHIDAVAPRAALVVDAIRAALPLHRCLQLLRFGFSGYHLVFRT